MSTEVYFSVDIEADGPIPGPYSMSSFGAVVAGYRKEYQHKALPLVPLDVGVEENSFYVELAPISDDFIPEAAAVSGLDRQKLIEEGADPAVAMAQFNDWVIETTKRIGGEFARPVLVAYPLPYDWMWIYWYLRKFHGNSAFGHSSALDIKTIASEKLGKLARKVGKRTIPRHLKSKRKHTHNALDDAREQGELFANLTLWDGKEK